MCGPESQQEVALPHPTNPLTFPPPTQNKIGELLDQIEYQVKGAANYVEEGTLQVQGAIEHAKKARKYQCCMLIFVLVLVGVLVLVFFVIKPR
jgi:t-SNARE complex subunit (syntaxin)